MRLATSVFMNFLFQSLSIYRSPISSLSELNSILETDQYQACFPLFKFLRGVFDLLKDIFDFERNDIAKLL